MIKICENCHKEWNARKSSKRFCGMECAIEFRKPNPMRCHHAECTETFVPERPTQKYCGHSCAAKASNARRRTAKPVRYCFCGEVLAKNSLNHCSAEHSYLYRTAHDINDWLGGTRSGSLKSGKLRRAFRQFLVEMAGHKCTKCGWGEPNPVTGKPILSVDHIDGNWQNNKPDNLLVLCYNCHTLTETFGYLNVGNTLVSETRRSSKLGKAYGL